MATLGKTNLLRVVRGAPPGFYLDGDALGEILLPGALIPAGAKVGGEVEVFVYRDSEDRLVATPQKPFAQVGEFTSLRVVAITPRVGAFLDWGLDKDLFLPLREQTGPLMRGERVVVCVTIDERSQRIVASARLKRHLDRTTPTYAEGQEVRLLVVGETPLGYNVVVEDAHRGLLYKSDLRQPLFAGAVFQGFVRRVREDGKIDVALDRAGHRRIASNTEVVLEKLRASGGSLPLHDDSSPDAIRASLGLSKKAFKQAIGSLFKARQIMIEPRGIRLTEQPSR